MNKRIFIIATLMAAPFVASAPALAIVPGSDTWVRAQETAQDQSVIEGRAGALVSGTSTFGYPSAPATHQRTIVPGSEQFYYERENQDLNDIIRSQPATGVAGVPGALVPGSDSF